MKTMTQSVTNDPADPRRAGERGYALLALLLALSIISIYLVSSVAPNVKQEVQRSKEMELNYRGNQMAKAIARYYGGRVLRPLQLQVPPPYGYLTELKKLSTGVTLGVQEVKFARGSEMIDPLTGIEWEPVRARDPRINAILNEYTAVTGAVIPLSYWLLAGPPAKKHNISLGASGGDSSSPQSGSQTGQPNGQAGTKPKSGEDPDDDDDDDDDVNDPLAHLFESDSNVTFGKSTVPIIGVAPKLKCDAVLPLRLGDVVLERFTNYKDWVFIYLPPQGFTQGVQPIVPIQPPGGKAPVSP
jgi:type II secretory pathway pseudopilin PulG